MDLQVGLHRLDEGDVAEGGTGGGSRVHNLAEKIEAIRGNRQKLVSESTDLIYHLLVMWADAGINPADVWAELSKREGISGIAERRAREQEDDV